MAEDNQKAALVSSLLNENKSPQVGQKVLIQEIDSSNSNHQENNDNTQLIVPEEINLMDMMLAAHKEAKQAADQVKTQERVKESKQFGGGFKKGFLGGSEPKKATKKSSSSSISATSSSSSSSSPHTSEIPTVTPQKSPQSSLVINDVQEAMKEESNPLLQQIKQGEWATPELIASLQDNAILGNGLKNPKCLAALQLLQTDPKEAQKRFQNDPDVSLFLQEFSKIMSEHFLALGNQQQQQQQQQQQSQGSTAAATRIQEIGPLHADAIARQKSQQQQKQAGTMIPSSSSSSNYESDEKVKQVLENEELRSLLMDAELQQILKECYDPQKFQQHMRNPVIAQKIKKLYDAGLVGTTK